MANNVDKVTAECVAMFDRIINDDSVPRNIRRSIGDAKTILLGGDVSPAVKATSAIRLLDEISNDPNIPLHIRTLVWGIASQLETISVDK